MINLKGLDNLTIKPDIQQSCLAEPGGPGENGGSLYLRFNKSWTSNNLNICIEGGNGGKGQSTFIAGGKGGQPGKPGQLLPVNIVNCVKKALNIWGKAGEDGKDLKSGLIGY